MCLGYLLFSFAVFAYENITIFHIGYLPYMSLLVALLFLSYSYAELKKELKQLKKNNKVNCYQ